MSIFRREQRSLFGEILDWMLTPLLLLWPISLVLTWLVAQNIAGKPFDRALELTVQRQAEVSARIEGLRRRLVDGIGRIVPDAIVNGDPEPGPDHRLPNIAHVTFPGCEGDAMLMLLDAQGVEVSTGSACQAGVPQPSHVLLAMGYDDAAARGSLRLSLGHTSTEADVDRLLAVLPQVHERAVRASLVRSR